MQSQSFLYSYIILADKETVEKERDVYLMIVFYLSDYSFGFLDKHHAKIFLDKSSK